MNPTEIIVHCTSTPRGYDYRAKDIDQWHRANGWEGIGYHYVIDIDGTIEKGRSCKKNGAHCIGHNSKAIGIVYVGGEYCGKYIDTRTPEQKKAMLTLIRVLQHAFDIPDSGVRVHNEFAAKACPCFSRAQLMSELASK